MATIKDLAAIREKFARVTPGRQEDFRLGVETTKKDWAAETAAAEPAYAAGVQAAISAKRFGKGVRKAGTERWKAKTLQVGVERWGTGVTASVADYEAGFAPFRETIAATKLPPRYPTGDPRNIERVKAIAMALHKKRVG